MKHLLTLILTVCGLGAPVAQAATFDEQTLTLFHYYANDSYQPGPGDEPKIFEWGRGDYTAGKGIILNEPNPFYTIDLVGNRITIDLYDEGFGETGDDAAFFVQGNGRNGLVVQDTYNTLPSFLSLELLLNDFESAPFVMVTEDELLFDFSAAGPTPGAAATWNVFAVPLPAGLPMLVAAMLGFGLLRRRRN